MLPNTATRTSKACRSVRPEKSLKSLHICSSWNQSWPRGCMVVPLSTGCGSPCPSLPSFSAAGRLQQADELAEQRRVVVPGAGADEVAVGHAGLLDVGAAD